MFSLEAGLAALLLLAFILLAHSGPDGNALPGEKLVAAQKVHDLLIVWARESASAGEMELDARLFLGSGYRVEADGKTFAVGRGEKEGLAISQAAVAEGIIVGPGGDGYQRIRVSLVQ